MSNKRCMIAVKLYHLLLLHTSGVVECLTMEGIVVPQYVYEGEGAELRCMFNLDKDTLYSVTWYKDHEEFYRYLPKDNPRQRTYRLEGANVDQQRSGVHVVKLKAATSAASGLYRCEVSAEAPSFTSAHDEKRMEVVSISNVAPKISDQVYPRDYRDGDMLALNCTAGRSHPPARIQWFVNGLKIPACFDVQAMPEGGGNGGAVSGLCLRLSKKHFRGGLLTVRCEATVGVDVSVFDKKDAIISVYGSSDINRIAWRIIFLNVFIASFCNAVHINILHTP